MIKPPWKSIWQFLMKMNINLSYDATFPFLDIYLSKGKHVPKRTCTRMLLSALLMVAYLETTEMAISWSVGKQIMVYSYSGKLFGHKKDWITLLATTWINLKNMLSERSPSQKNPDILLL